MPVVSINLYHQVIMRQVEVHKVRTERFMPLELISSQGKGLGDEIFEGRRLRHTVALLGTVASPASIWSMALNSKGLATNGTLKRYTSLSPLVETGRRTVDSNTSANLTYGAIYRSTAVWAGGSCSKGMSLLTTFDRTVMTILRAVCRTISISPMAFKSFATNNTDVLFHTIPIISRTRLFYQLVHTPAAFDDGNVP